ncbi:nitrogen regulation protein NR(II) [Desulforhabdus sp. TSK]|uniref:two-component system sensor histidine kinase NtrB n=1 Tax=Desulforhabdus sp. TSK TaxID=2925014 RepID=UPI001FC89377|nr:ATP-binding protein [Desulforhabdus sp. TSK]GKT09312.1 hypothetical protein DSTSK_26170 [Desulforhabdus sp. TSK]
MKENLAEPPKFRLRLVVALPTLLPLVMIACGMVVMSFTGPSFHGASGDCAEAAKTTATAWMMLMAAIACLGNLCAALFISHSMRDLIDKMGSLIRQSSMEAGPAVLVADNEINALQLLFEKVGLSLDRFRSESSIVQNLPQAMITIDEAGKVKSANKTALSLLSLSEEPPADWSLKDIIPGDFLNQTFYGLIEEGFQGEAHPSPQLMNLSLNKGEPRDYLVETSPAWDISLHEKRLTLILRDPSSLSALKEQILRLERLAALGQMAARIAHEVRNPLGAIRALSELVQEDLSREDPHHKYVEDILVQIERLNHLVEEVLSFSRNPVNEKKAVDLNGLMAEAVRTAQLCFPQKNISVAECYPPELPSPLGDKAKLSQVFLNILRNAFEACGKEGAIRIATDCRHGRNGDPGHVLVKISDDGPGVGVDPPERIFEPFYSTKPSGTGLGMATAHNIVTAHGGRLEVQSGASGGTTISVLLPMETSETYTP